MAKRGPKPKAHVNTEQPTRKAAAIDVLMDYYRRASGVNRNIFPYSCSSCGKTLRSCAERCPGCDRPFFYAELSEFASGVKHPSELGKFDLPPDEMLAAAPQPVKRIEMQTQPSEPSPWAGAGSPAGNFVETEGAPSEDDPERAAAPTLLARVHLGQLTALDAAMIHWSLKPEHILTHAVKDAGVVIVTAGGRKLHWPNDEAKTLSDMERGQDARQTTGAGIFSCRKCGKPLLGGAKCPACGAARG